MFGALVFGVGVGLICYAPNIWKLEPPETPADTPETAVRADYKYTVEICNRTRHVVQGNRLS
jgi:hypothetical protein